MCLGHLQREAIEFPGRQGKQVCARLGFHHHRQLVQHAQRVLRQIEEYRMARRESKV